ncbi:LysR family transcriptional regulator, partial [Enterococcus faecium]|nr:LysR family transcriptional regulator [Enterococcus faecium]
VTKFLSHLPFPNKLCSRNSFFENKLKFHKNLRSNFRTFLLLS